MRQNCSIRHQQLLDHQLDLAVEGSNSLNSRATTITGLIGTTLALVANASVTNLERVEDLKTGYLILMAVIFFVALATLSACVVYALSALRPNRASSERLQELMNELRGDSFRTDQVRALTWEALSYQRAANDRKSELMRRAYVWAGAGTVSVVLAIAFYCAASRVG